MIHPVLFLGITKKNWHFILVKQTSVKPKKSCLSHLMICVRDWARKRIKKIRMADPAQEPHFNLAFAETTR